MNQTCIVYLPDEKQPYQSIIASSSIDLLDILSEMSKQYGETTGELHVSGNDPLNLAFSHNIVTCTFPLPLYFLSERFIGRFPIIYVKKPYGSVFEIVQKNLKTQTIDSKHIFSPKATLYDFLNTIESILSPDPFYPYR